jgi:DNA repair protein XRS2
MGAGEYAIFDKTISRKHLTIRIDEVPEGEGRNLRSRSQITIHDLDTKKGTIVNGTHIRGQRHIVTQDVNQIQLAACPKLLRITWNPVVFSFSFTSKELRSDPWTKLRDDLEQLDIKYSADYERSLTSHVISKKRNTSKGLQALIHGKYIVTDSFITAVVEAATTSVDPHPDAVSALEQDYDGNWPNPLDHLPPRGEEPSTRPAEAYAPDERRREVFDGYSFVFYDKKQYDTLFPVIAAGKGKARLKEATPGETDVDDFIRYVKSVAGEKGLGVFEDGSEGKGVVLVRYLPAKGPDFDWYAEFLTSVALRLDHRPIDQREFLEAILACNATMLRRPLEEESQPDSAAVPPQQSRYQPVRTEADVRAVPQFAPQQESVVEPSQPVATQRRRGRARRVAGSRFKGFASESDDDDRDIPTADIPESAPAATQPSQPRARSHSRSRPGTQVQFDEESMANTQRTTRKRAHSPIVQETPSEIMESLVPSAAAFKRRRIEAGEDPIPASAPEPEIGDEDGMDMDPAPTGKTAAKGRKKAKEEVDILERARKHREEEEARAAAERESLNEVPDDHIDYAAIRRMHIVEECEVKYPDSNRASENEKEGGSGWDPKWNGRPNFKRFRKQGEPVGRPAPRVIVSLQEVKTKEYGIGDDYWLEDEGTAGTRKNAASQKETQSEATQAIKTESLQAPSSSRRPVVVDSSEDDDDELDESEPRASVQPEPEPEPEPEPSRSRTAKAAVRASTRTQTQATHQTETQTQTQATPRGSGKRAATGPPAAAKAKPAKKPRRGAVEVQDSEDSEDEPRFRFGRR